MEQNYQLSLNGISQLVNGVADTLTLQVVQIQRISEASLRDHQAIFE